MVGADQGRRLLTPFSTDDQSARQAIRLAGTLMCMWSLCVEDVGTSAWNRMLREQVISLLAPGLALPADVEPTAPLRRHVLRGHVPPGTTVSGAAALWVHWGGPPPRAIDICAPWTHRLKSRHSTWPLLWHHTQRPQNADPSDRADVHDSDAALWIESVPRAIVDALRWSPDLGDGLTLAYTGLQHGVSADEVGDELTLLSPQDRTSARARHAWASVLEAYASTHC